MKRFLFALLSIFIILSAQAQKTYKKEKLVIYPPFTEFFIHHPSFKEIRFKKSYLTDSFDLELIEKGTPGFQSANRFDLGNIGELYFFQKLYGDFKIPVSLYTDLIDKSASRSNISGTIRNDSAFIEVQNVFYTKEDEEYFEKVESQVEYKQGIHVLAKELEAQHNKHSPMVIRDSVIIMRLLIEKNGTISDPRIIHGDSTTPWSKMLLSAIQSSGPWIPMEACGRKVRAYKELYIALLPDGSMMARLSR